MIRSYLRIALRHLTRQAGYSFINVFGLAVGLGTCLVILSFVWHELQFDRFHANADRIYQVVSENTDNDRVSRRVPGHVAPEMVETYPEVEAGTDVWIPFRKMLVVSGEKRFYEQHFVQATPEVFDLFSFEPVRGDLSTALDNSGSVVITTETARRYFGDDDPLGQTITTRDESRLEMKDDGTGGMYMSENDLGDVDYTVTAVVEPPPSTSSLQFDFLASRQPSTFPGWNISDVNAYVLLREDADVDGLRSKMADFVARNAGSLADRYRIYLQPLADVHLHPSLGKGDVGMGPLATIYVFAAAALVILLIACINYVNMGTARSLRRAREVGVRKSVGATRRQLALQFLGESTVSTVLAMAMGLVLAELALGPFNAFLGLDLTLGFVGQPEGALALAALGVTTALLTGSAPAFYLSRFRPAQVLKGLSSRRAGGTGLRTALVVLQFGGSMVLLIATLVMHRQMDYVRRERLNALDDQIIVVDKREALGDGYDAFKQALTRFPEVEEVATGQQPGGTSFILPGTFKEDSLRSDLHLIFADEDYLATLGVGLVAGVPFRQAREDSLYPRPYVIVNRTAMQVAGLGDPSIDYADAIGTVDTPFNGGTLIGVMEDYHFLPMNQYVKPLAVFSSTNPQLTKTILVRLRSGAITQGLERIRQTWDRFVSDRPLSYAFLDDELDRSYRSELRMGRLISVFAGLAILVACLGLFGLAAYTAEQRTREIGIRKVLGASVGAIVTLLSKDFARLVIVAVVLASPIAYYLTSRWLEDFVYRIDLSWMLFAAAGLGALVLALATVSYQAVKAARTDPVRTLRYE